MNWLLYLVLIIIIGCCWYGYKAGFIKIVFSVVSIIIALFVTALLTPVVSNLLKTNEDVYGYFENIVVDFVDLEGKTLDSDEQQEDFIKELSLPTSITNLLLKNNSAETYKEKGINKFQDYIVDSIVGLIINAISFIIVYFIVRIVIFIVGKLLDVISKMPVLEKINKNIGIVIGLFQGLLITWLIFVVIFIASNTSFGQSATACIDESIILTFLYENNLLINLSTMFF